MRKFALFLLFVGVTTVIASLYGVADHQLTYSVSPEYYTKFKFIQLNLADTLAAQHMTQPRSAVVIAGVKTSWLIGICIGAILGIVAFIFPTADTMFPSALQALGLTTLITILITVAAYYFRGQGAIGNGAWHTLPARLPDSLGNKPAFFLAAGIQYSTLLGCGIGVLAGLILLVVRNTRVRRNPA